MRRKIIIDTDPGVDDAYAILAALMNPELEVMGICCVCGNKGLDKVVPNALRLTQFLNKAVMVYPGAAGNIRLVRDHIDEGIAADYAHGPDGMGNSGLPYDQHNLSPQAACDFILETVAAYPHQVEILAIGPLTNLALACEKDPQTMRQLKAIYSMGGGIKRGNFTPFAEYNYYFDELAADIVYRTLQEDVAIHMIGLDATHSTLIDHNDLAFMRYEGGALGALIHHITQVYCDLYYHANGYLGAVIHDVDAYLYMIDPGVATATLDHVSIKIALDEQHRGQTVIVPDKKAKTQCVMAMDRIKTNQRVIAALFPDKLNAYIRSTTPR